jgi:LysM repeat protein
LTAPAILLLLILSVCPWTLTVVQAQDNAPLFTEGFEEAFKPDPYCKTGACAVPAGWGVWFIPRRETDQPGINFQPQYAQSKAANRFKAGAGSQRIYAENATFTGGIFRIVANVKVGAKLRFSAWGESWSTNDESPISARPSTDIKLKIGIDPMGGNNGQASPLNGQVVWSEERDAKDAFTQFSVEVEAKAQTVIVYMYSTMKDPVRHNEVFWDDAVLEYTAPPPTLTPTVQSSAAVTGTPAAGTEVAATQPVSATTASAAPTGAPAGTPAPQASGGITHTVVEGDTLFAIALKYNKSVEELKRLNGLSSDLINIGQVIIIEPAPVSGSTSAPAAVQPTQVQTATATPATGALCVLAFFDNNGDGSRDKNEDPVPNVLFTVTANGAGVATYTTDGVNEPYCIGNLNAGSYTVAATVATGYNATTPLNDTVAVPGGAAAKFSVGLRRVADGNAVVAPGATNAPQAASGGSGPSVLSILATVGGGLIILGAIGFGVMFFVQGRRL